MGILDQFGEFASTPGGQGLLTAIAAGMAGARRGAPVNTIGAGLLGGLQGYSNAQQQQLLQAREAKQNDMLDLQLKQAQQGQADQEAIRGLAKQYYKAPSMSMGDVMSAPGQAGPTFQRAGLIPQTQGAFDTQGFINGVMGVDPIKGMQLKASIAKETPFNKIDPKDFSPESVARFAQTGNYGDLIPARKMELTPGGQVWNPYQATPGQSFQDPNKLFSLGANGELVPNTALQSFELKKAKAGKPETNVVVDAAPKAFWSDFGKQASDQLFAERGAAQSASATLQSIGEIRKAVQGGAFLGAGADLKLGAAKALSAIGFNIAPDSVANSEKFNAQANSFVLEKIKTLGANPSNADREFIEKTVPRLSSDPGALPELLNFMERKARAQISSFNGKIKGVQQQKGAGFMPYSLEVPEPEGMSASSDMDALVNKYRSR